MDVNHSNTLSNYIEFLSIGGHDISPKFSGIQGISPTVSVLWSAEEDICTKQRWRNKIWRNYTL